MKRYMQKVFRDSSERTIKAAQQWAAENVKYKWDWCLVVLGTKVCTVIEWYEEV